MKEAAIYRQQGMCKGLRVSPFLTLGFNFSIGQLPYDLMLLCFPFSHYDFVMSCFLVAFILFFLSCIHALLPFLLCFTTYHLRNINTNPLLGVSLLGYST